jgi:hypothetical protein
MSGSTYRDLDIDLLAQVKPTYLRQYVKAQGWARVATTAAAFADIAIFRKDDEELLVPQKIEFVDYARRIGDIVALLSGLEKRKNIEILSDIILPPSDVMRFRLDSPTMQSGTIPLSEGFGLIGGGRKALLASAHQVLSPQRFHPRLKRGEAEAFINSCRMGQTERGSFIATFVCPFQDAGDLEADQQITEPFTRKVTAGLVRSVGALVSAIDNDDIGPLKKQVDGVAIVSANFCDAILEIQPEGTASNLDINVSWSPTIQQPTNISTNLRIRTDYIQQISEIAKELRPHQAPQEMPIVGKIDALQGMQGDDGRMSGEVVVFFIHDEDQTVKARVDLTAEEYITACDAHKDGRHIQMIGTFYRGTRVNWIRDHRDFKLFSP